MKRPDEKSPVSVRYVARYDSLCRELAARLGAPLVEADDPDGAKFQVEVDGDVDGDGVRHGLVLRCNDLPGAPLRINFDRVRAGPDPLLKAVGRRARTVVDATAGWGVDAVHLARRGMTVTAVEKNPVVAALLAHAHAACSDAQLKARLAIVHGDSIAYLGGMLTPPDVVYLDPMYPPPSSAKSVAAAKKPLVLLRMLAGPADDCAPLFAQAMSRATQRVVVKRPRRAQPLQPGRVGETGGKLVRFDIYQPPTK